MRASVIRLSVILFGLAATSFASKEALAGATQDVPDRSSRTLTVARTTGPIVIDGVLEERDWTEAPIAAHFIQNEPNAGQPATEDTEVKVLYDTNNLYVGVFAHDRDPGGIIVSELKKDFTENIGDIFQLVLDTFHDERNGYLFAVNPAGAKSDAQMVNEGRESNPSWDGIWDVKTRITESGWVAEIVIPFKTLKFGNDSPQTWGVNFLRRVRRRNEDSFWAPLPRIYTLSRVSMAGTLEGLRDLRPGANLRVKPYGLASVGRTGGTPSEGDASAGFDVKYAPTSGLTWDFTVNTDFAQVEADEQQVNLSRFSLLFPEKRDFFLENSGVFKFGVGNAPGGGAAGGRQDDAARNDVILFFSRQIGISTKGDAVPIVAGTRLTGRAGLYSVGALNIQQKAQPNLPSTNFTALRLRRDILGSSDIGVMALNKDAAGGGYNRVVGFDANFRFFRNLNINNQATKTFSPAGAVRAGSGDDAMLRSSFDYRGNVWDFRGSYTNVGDRFNDEMGYVPRVGITKTTAFFAPHIRSKRLPGWLRETWPHWDFSQVRRNADGNLDSRYYDYHWPFTFQNGGSAEVGFQRSIEGLTVPFRINARRGIVIPAGEYAFNDYYVTARTNPAEPFSFNFRVGQGDFYDGYRHIYQGGVAARYHERLNVTATFARNVITLSGGAFDTNLLSSRVVYNFSTTMFVNALLQYNTDARQWSSNVRFNIIHHPLSDFFVVYNERRDTITDVLIDRALIVKITHMISF